MAVIVCVSSECVSVPPKHCEFDLSVVLVRMQSIMGFPKCGALCELWQTSGQFRVLSIEYFDIG